MTTAHDKRTLEQRLEWIANWSEPDIDLADAGTCREALDHIKAQAAEIDRLRAELAEARKEKAQIVAYLDRMKVEASELGQTDAVFWIVQVRRAIEANEHKGQSDAD